MRKTLLFSLSSADVYKNFFFFPGSLADKIKILSENDDLKVVFIVSAKERDQYAPLLEEKLGMGVEIAACDLHGKLSFGQRFFCFFYSYLVYTGTTKTLATMGMRAEDAPGAGRRSLAILKILIANTFGRISFVKKRAVPYLYLKAFQTRPFKEIFEKYSPDLIFAPNIFSRFDMEILAESKRRGIKTIGMVTGWDHLDKYYLPFHSDLFLAESEQIKKFATDLQAYEPEKVKVVGYPYFDFIFQVKNRPMSREEVLRRLGFPPESKYILYIAGTMYCPDEPDIIEAILKQADGGRFGNDLRLVIRPYPGARGKDREFDEKKFQGFSASPKVSFYMDRFWGDTAKTEYFLNIMKNADIVMAIYSTAVLEAAALDRPLLVPAFDGYQKRPLARSIRRFEMREHFKDILKIGALRRAFSFEELFSFIENYLKNPKLDSEKRKLLMRELVGPFDGKNSERVLNYLLKI